MKMMTRDKLDIVLGFVGHNGRAIPLEYISQLYDKYGDDYFINDSGEWQILTENSYWKNETGYNLLNNR